MSALRASARVAVLIGAVGSVGLTLYAGRQNPSNLLLVAFAIWVLSPFVLIILVDSASMRWPSSVSPGARRRRPGRHVDLAGRLHGADAEAAEGAGRVCLRGRSTGVLVSHRGGACGGRVVVSQAVEVVTFRFDEALPVLKRTPGALRTLLQDLPGSVDKRDGRAEHMEPVRCCRAPDSRRAHGLGAARGTHSPARRHRAVSGLRSRSDVHRVPRD